MTALLICEHDNACLNSSTLTTLTAALQLGSKVTAMVIGSQCDNAAREAAMARGVQQVIQVDDADLLHPVAEKLAVLIASQAERYTHILAPATTFGKDFMPRLAALLDSQQISDIVTVCSADTFVRPIYAGNALQKIQSDDAIKIITVRSIAFAPAGSQPAAPINRTKIAAIPARSARFSGIRSAQSKRPDLGTAKVVVSGGRGLQSAENFSLVFDLADCLNAAVGASRAAVDAGYIANNFQIGQTGRIVAPDLYVAVGISGAIQHLAGMKGSKVIVAINSDPDAPIFNIADYSLCGDLFTIVPELIAAIKNT